MMVRRVTWPVYSVAGKPTAFHDMSIPLVIQGYMIIMKGEEGAIRERMLVAKWKGMSCYHPLVKGSPRQVAEHYQVLCAS